MQGGYVITWDEGVRKALEAAVRGAEDAGEVPAGSADSMGAGSLSLTRPQAGAVIARDRRLGNMTSSPGAIHLVAGLPGDA